MSIYLNIRMSEKLAQKIYHLSFLVRKEVTGGPFGAHERNTYG